MKKSLPIILVIAAVLVVGGGIIFAKTRRPQSSTVAPTPSPLPPVAQLAEDKQPKVSLQFSSDAHYVTVNISNIHADQLEYNLIYNATVKNQAIQTGVNAQSKLSGKTEFSQKQLLGSESSGKFTYHINIHDAIMELTLRDSANRSIFTATYPFEIEAGASVDLTPAS